MKDKIHFGTIEKYFEEKFGCTIAEQCFGNKLTSEVYHLLCEENADIAFFTVKQDGSHICLDSNGDLVDEEYIFGYINGEYVSGTYAESQYASKELNIKYEGKEIDLNELSELDERMYPKRTSIVLNNMFSESQGITKFLVDEIAYVNSNEFESISQGYNSEVLKQYNTKNYEYFADGTHGMLIINEDTGDGLIVDTQGYDYARYFSFAPQIRLPIEYMLEQHMREEAVHEMKLYMPIQVTEYDYDDEQEVEADAYQYYYEIKKKVKESLDDCQERGLAKYFCRDSKCRNKVYSIKPDVEMRNNHVMGVAVIKMTKPLNEEELESLKDYVSGQFSDGWGESFEQHEIQVSGREIYVHFWNSDNYFIHTEEEQQEYEMNQEQKMSGMQGMEM